jgi:ADP-ribosylglycohydrolase
MTSRRARPDTAPKLPLDGSSPTAERVVGSSVWAAYGDALGFISELTDEAGLLRRTQGVPLVEPVSWQRRIGGRQGVNVVLPAGCYSDDTQLRLSTARAIGPNGFDVEAFAKVELTVWPSYALGGGRGTKAAATSLAKDQIAWYANTFKGWTDCGGNGAAMRIQPHVWSSRELDDPTGYLRDVVRNTICTHGSPIGILGAVLHALALAHATSTGEVPTPPEMLRRIDEAACVPDLMRKDPEVGEYWLGLWERATGRSFEEAWIACVSDARDVVQVAVESGGSKCGGYRSMLDRLGLFHPSTRGSGILTALAAVALLWFESRPREAVIAAATAIGSDTDTIGTMAGAIAGACASELPPIEVLDLPMLEREATRLAALAAGPGDRGHRYPDLLHWSPPRTQSDALVQGDGGLEVVGLGPASAASGGSVLGTQKEFLWQWVNLDLGQSLLIKRRKELERVHRQTLSIGDTEDRTHRSLVTGETNLTLLDRTDRAADTMISANRPREDVPAALKPLDRGVKLEDVLAWLDESKLQNDASLGYVLRRVARDGTPDQLALLVGTLRERIRRQ